MREKYYAADHILDALAKMVVFDAFIGNMDRHHENWGVIEHNVIRFGQRVIHPQFLKDQSKLSTLFDHGSSLLFELDENKVVKYLKNLADFQKHYIEGKKYSFFVNKNGELENVFSLIKWYIESDSKNWGKRFKRAIKEIFIQPGHSMDFKIAKLILKMPPGYSDERKMLLFESLKRRKNILLNYL